MLPPWASADCRVAGNAHAWTNRRKKCPFNLSELRVRCCINIQAFVHSMSPVAVRAEEIHPSLWRASQLAQGRGRVVDTGYPTLSAELPGGGWPVGSLIDLLVQQAGVGELRLLRPALNSLGKRPVALLQPPHTPDALGLSYIGLSLDKVMLVKAPGTADALWSAETLFIMVRPLATAQDSSPALLRLALRPAEKGMTVDIVKRRGPARAEPLSIPLQPTPVLFSSRPRSSRRHLTPIAARGMKAEAQRLIPSIEQ